jgi:hypothetical protein
LHVIDGSLLQVNGNPAERIRYTGAATNLHDVWIATQAGLTAVLSSITLEQIIRGPARL